MGSSPIEAVDSMLTRRQQLITKLKNTLTKAQNRMKYFADQKRRDLSFDVNSWVYVKLRPYRQKTATSASYTKLSQRYYGPFQVLARIGQVAYHLNLPPSSKIHPVFHCSLLKQHQGPIDTIDTTAPTLPPNSVNNHPLVTPLAILASKWDSSTDPPTRMLLVQWQGLNPEDTSWEDWPNLSKTYHLEDKVSFPAEGDVSNPIIINTPTISEDSNSRPNNKTDQPKDVVQGKRTARRPGHLKDYV
ncbi:hypothetical protein A2U01_0015003 [Trifolium medium]|uniref:Tf2-1-like SH3-like domain-containing protein n=1 Tax=Trifolium medium TaxID=97028 RepID=A0A392N4Z3_9FABA|nr:hypothetical protein [Trifolium medium]